MKAAVNFLPNKIVTDFMKFDDHDHEQEFLLKLNQETKDPEKFEDTKKIKKDLKSAHIIIATKKTDRIVRQNGNFIMPAYELTQTSVNDSIAELAAKDLEEEPIEFTIDQSKKTDILQQLSKIGIHNGSVYPDVANQTKYLKNFFSGFKPRLSISDENPILKKILSGQRQDRVLIQPSNLLDTIEGQSDLTLEQKEFIARFHTRDIVFVEKNDDYFAGIRANHFVVEIGVSECEDSDAEFAMITANHKGDRMVTVIKL